MKTLFDKAVFELFCKPGEVIEVRIPKVYGKSSAWGDEYAKGTVSGYFDDHAAFCKSVNQADKAVHDGIYFTLQVIDPRLIGRAFNRLKPAQHTTSDNNVTAYRWLPVDIDPARPSGVSSSDAELSEAIGLREAIFLHVTKELGLPYPIQGMSGNGAHLLFRLPDIPVNEQTILFVKKNLEAIAGKFSTDKISIDTTVFNPARIWKLYGTKSRKGDEVPAGPGRKQGRIGFLTSTALERSMSEQKANYETFNQKFQEWKEEQGQHSPQPHQGEDKLDVGKYLSHYGIEYKVKTNGEWVRYCLSRCVFDSSHSGGEASIGQHISGKLTYQCFHNSCKGRTWAEARRLISGEDKLTQFMPGNATKPKQEKPKARLKTLNELKSKFSGQVSYLWKRHIPKGMPIIINGREGVGKSKNCLAIARDILLANPRGSIIWVSSEGFVSDTITKAYEVGLPMDGRFHIAEKPDGTYRFDFRWKEDQDLLAGLLEQVSDQILCVFIDSIRGMTGGMITTLRPAQSCTSATPLSVTALGLPSFTWTTGRRARLGPSSTKPWAPLQRRRLSGWFCPSSRQALIHEKSRWRKAISLPSCRT